MNWRRTLWHTNAPSLRCLTPTLHATNMVSWIRAIGALLLIAIGSLLLVIASRHRRRIRRVAAPLAAIEQLTCRRTVLESVQAAELAFVVTWSGSSRGSSGNYSGELFSGLVPLVDYYRDDPKVVFVVDAKGSHCSELPALLDSIRLNGRLHCIQGPNMASREAHTILRFCADFYDHLPRAVVFVQDDPDFAAVKGGGVGTAQWFRQLEAAHRARASQERPRVASPYDVPYFIPCPCWIQREGNHALQEMNVSAVTYGHYRTVMWWLRTFVRPFNEQTEELPRRLWYPAHAQLAVTRDAIRSRSRRFYELNEALAGMPSPRKSRLVRYPGELEHECVAYKKFVGKCIKGMCMHKGLACNPREWCVQGHACTKGECPEMRRECTMTKRERSVKWVNFGPWVVDLGERPPFGKPFFSDRRPVAHGMDIAMMYERLWFTIFDPLMQERLPTHPECYTYKALLEGPVRCGRDTCPHEPAHPSLPAREACAATDRLGLTRSPAASVFTAASIDPSSSKCLAKGCLAVTDERREMLQRRGRTQDACATEECRNAVQSTDWVSANCSTIQQSGTV